MKKNSNFIYKFAKRFILKIKESLGIDLRIIISYYLFPRYLKDRKEWLKQGGKITKNWIILTDYIGKAGNARGHYFHQDLLVSKLIFDDDPKRHIDIGSRIDGFVAHVASFREIEVCDIRKIDQSVHKNIKFVQHDFMNPKKLGLTDSLSCLQAIEHFGLGRYTDPINVNGHIEGIDNMISMIKKDGKFYLSCPIGLNDEIHFNAHRVFHPLSLLEYDCIKKNMELERFDYINDNGDLFCESLPKEVVGKMKYGLGIYTFKKVT